MSNDFENKPPEPMKDAWEGMSPEQFEGMYEGEEPTMDLPAAITAAQRSSTNGFSEGIRALLPKWLPIGSASTFQQPDNYRIGLVTSRHRRQVIGRLAHQFFPQSQPEPFTESAASAEESFGPRALPPEARQRLYRASSSREIQTVEKYPSIIQPAFLAMLGVIRAYIHVEDKFHDMKGKLRRD